MHAIDNKLVGLRENMESLANCIGENMKRISEHIRTQSKSPLGIWHAKTLASQATNNCYAILSAGPLGMDLQFVIHSVRVIHDYERIDELLHALASRDLNGVNLEIAISIADTLDQVISAHEDFKIRRIVKKTVDFNPIDYNLNVKLASKSSKVLVAKFLEEQHKSEDAVEVVLACRHVDRIQGLIQEMNQEIA